MQFHVVLVLLALVVVASARNGHTKHKDNSGCKYDKGEWSVCDTATNEMKRTLTLKKQKEGCETTMEQTRPCKNKKLRCKYNKGEWGECDSTTNLRSRSLTFKKGDPECDQISTQTISCEKYNEIMKMKENKKAAKESARAEKRVFKEMHKKLKHLHKMGCQFREENSECNMETQKITKTFILMQGEAESCVMDPVEISCRMHETYERIRQEKMEKKQRRKEMKKKSKSKQKKKQNKKEKRRNRKTRDKCKYQPGPWSECDITTDTMKMTMTLKAGDVNMCPASKLLSKKCKKPCKYTTGKWGPCKHGITERVDRLKKNSQDMCESERKLTKKCNGKKKIKKIRGDCIYGKGTWGECDSSTNKRAKTKLLTSGSLLKCKPQKIVYRSCSRKDGKDRCFFGSWGDWSDCQNGVQKKQREVVQGGVDCQKRAVRTRPCS